MYKYFFIFVTSVLLTGCYDRFRYPCQDPNNSEKEECSIESCQVSRTCPNLIERHTK